MRLQTGAVLLFCLLFTLPGCSSEQAAGNDRIAQLHRDALVWDCHNDLSYRAISRPWWRQMPGTEDIDLRIATNHMDAGRDWPLENLPTIDDVLDHIDHAVRVAGIDHVGLGADMYPRTPSPVGIRGVHDYPNITRGLKERGYSDEDVRKIMGGNLLRVWKIVTDKSD